MKQATKKINAAQKFSDLNILLIFIFESLAIISMSLLRQYDEAFIYPNDRILIF